MTSPVYWHPVLYHYVMKFLYGKNFESRYETISDFIPPGVSVTEVCSGDAYLFRKYLRKKNIKYTGLDINPAFVRYGKKNNVSMEIHNLLTDKIPAADYVIIQASLYQFIPKQKIIIRKLLDATAKYLLIAEPIRNLADSDNPIISFLAKYSANPGNEHAIQRFRKNSLLELFQEFPEFKKAFEIKGGREMIGIFKK